MASELVVPVVTPNAPNRTIQPTHTDITAVEVVSGPADRRVRLPRSAARVRRARSTDRSTRLSLVRLTILRRRGNSCMVGGGPGLPGMRQRGSAARITAHGRSVAIGCRGDRRVGRAAGRCGSKLDGSVRPRSGGVRKNGRAYHRARVVVTGIIVVFPARDTVLKLCRDSYRITRQPLTLVLGDPSLGLDDPSCFWIPLPFAWRFRRHTAYFSRRSDSDDCPTSISRRAIHPCRRVAPFDSRMPSNESERGRSSGG